MGGNTISRPAVSSSRQKRRRRRRLKKKRTMEGIRLRTDSTGSTKNAFYQGTIVSDSHQGPGNGDDAYQRQSSQQSSTRRKKKGISQLNRSSRSTLSMGSAAPPLPRRSTKNLTASNRSSGDPFSVISPDNSKDGEGAFFGISDPQNEQRDSLRYSTQSIFSSMSQRQMLLGTNFLSEESSRGLVMEGLGNSISSELSLEEMQGGFADPGGDPSMAQMNNHLRFSNVSTSSGIYFQQPAPPGPLNQPGMLYGSIMQPRMSDTGGINNNINNNKNKMQKYPTQQTNRGSQSVYHSKTMQEHRSTQPRQMSITIEEDEESSADSDGYSPLSEQIMDCLDISLWLSKDVSYDDEGVPYFESSTNYSLAGVIRWLFYNPFYPEFTSLQQFSWAVAIGVFMGVFTAGWKVLIEFCVEFTWKTLPEFFLNWGMFTDVDGAFPLYHYMWIVPGLLGGILSYIITAMATPIPTQNDWIHTLHSRGVQEADTFLQTFILATVGMASGLSLGPELPLVLTAGMIGSWLGLLCRQSMLQARVMNLTAASAAIGGFFGFPMAGALFVLEVPHRMGLQYFEALSPATIASIVAVLINRIVINDDVTGMFQYPFLNESLPSYIFKDAIVYGLLGAALGIVYTLCTKKLKGAVHAFSTGFESHSSAGTEEIEDKGQTVETTPLVRISMQLNGPVHQSLSENRDDVHWSLSKLIPHDPTRAAVTGALAGIIVRITCMFYPHVMFWGEAQLQTMIDKGRTPLPVFGAGDEPTAALVALGKCMVDENQDSEFSLGCSFAIIFAKIFVTGLSLGTGIVGGHFWAPLFVGCVASHAFTDVMNMVSSSLGVSFSLAQYPCVALLCIMGATHVVTFRAHMAIILILTLTIDAFVPENSALGNFKVAGDYSAVFPLLTVSVFVALQVSRHITFYEKQRSRGDIQALPEALCEPGKEGKPWVMDYDGKMHALDDSDYEYETESEGDDSVASINREDIEANFKATSNAKLPSQMPLSGQVLSKQETKGREPADDPLLESLSSLNLSLQESESPSTDLRKRTKKQLKTLDDLLNGPIQSPSKQDERKQSADAKRKKKTHRRTQSEPFFMENAEKRTETLWNSQQSPPGVNRRPVLKRIDSYGVIDQDQPSLMDQVRRRAASNY